MEWRKKLERLLVVKENEWEEIVYILQKDFYDQQDFN